ncbi:hypothetical protein [Piscinibacter defluvii]|uniref:hypothetical protein n=1 Tax=Piscinibacter defluvii TaxID=1796922 RepID=UPI000FDDE63F|nr:hypothetical protein [Piscinibacter defluvii]
MTRRAVAALLLFVLGGGCARAEPLRDPMQPPAEARSAVAGSAAPSAAPAAAAAPVLRQILVVDGRRYAVEGTRLRGVGDRFGERRIERIGDDAIWLRDGARLQRVPLFAGITRQAAAEPATAASSATPLPAPALARAPRLRPTDTP